MLVRSFFLNKLPKISLTIGLLLITLPTLVWAGEFTAFGPENYVRGTGSPVVVTNNFSVPNPNTEFFLRVYNGGLEDAETELVSSTVISINGTQVLGPNKFNQNVTFVETPITLQSYNTIEVEVRGKPGGLLAVLIVGIDNATPIIQITDPPNNSLTNINPYGIKLSFNDDISGISADAFRIYINDIDKTNAFDMTITGLSGVASGEVVLPEGINVIRAIISDFAGNSSTALTSFIVDTTPPVISNLSPVNGSILADAKPVITTDFTDQTSGVDVSTVKVTFDGVDVTSGATVSVAGVSYTPATEIPDGVHTVTVDVTDNAGNPAPQAQWSFTTDITIPQLIINEVTSPTNISIQTITGTYTEERIDIIKVNGINATIDGTAKTYSAEASLTEGENIITVVATDLAGNTGSATVTIVLDLTAPAPPTGLVATPGDIVVDLNWAANTELDLAGYNLYRSQISGGPYTKLNSQLITQLSYQDTNVEKSIEYYYVVTAVDNAGNESANSKEVAVIPADTTPPAPPTGLAAAAGDTIIDLSWNNNTESDLSGYNIYRSQLPQGGPYNKVNTELIIATTYKDTGLTNGTTYYYVVTAIDTIGNESEYSNEASATPEAWITNVSDTNDSFSPNGDGHWDSTTITYLLTKQGYITIKLYDANNSLVRTLKDYESQPSGTNTAVWDGKDDNGNVLPDGTYTYRINAQDSQGNSIPQQQGTSTIDNHFIRIITPVQGSTLSGIATFTAEPSPYITDEKDVRFYYRVKGTGKWLAMNDNYGRATQQPDGTWTIDWDTETVGNNVYQIKIYAAFYDLNGKYRSGTGGAVVDYTSPSEYTVENEAPDIANLTVIPNPFSPDESGTWIDLDTGEVFNDPAPGLVLDDIAAISFTASARSFFDIKVVDDQNQLVRQLVKGALYPDPETQEIELQWDGRDNNGNFVRNGQYELVVNPDSSEKEKSITIGVNSKPFITHVKAVPNPFSPDGDGQDDTTTIYYNLSQNSYVTVEIYQQDTLVRTLVDNQLLPCGGHAHVWDGKDDQGQYLFGRYTIKISAQAETGNIADPAFLDVSLLWVTDIRISRDELNPYLDQTTTITYRISKEGSLSIKIYKEDDTLVRNLIVDEYRSPGEHSEVWDGRNDNGNIVPDGVYYFIVKDSLDTQDPIFYDPRGTGGRDISKSIGFFVTDFDTLTNKFCTLTYNLPQSAKINIKVRYRRYSGPAVKVIKYQEPTSSGQHQALWDGRDEAGNFLDYAAFTFAIWGYTLDENSIIVVGGRPELSNVSISPICFNPSASPYILDDFQKEGTISFDLSRLANVTINIYDSSGYLVRTLLDIVLCNQGQNSVIWDGKDNESNLVLDDYYRIIIQAHKDGNYSESFTLHAEVSY